MTSKRTTPKKNPTSKKTIARTAPKKRPSEAIPVTGDQTVHSRKLAPEKAKKGGTGTAKTARGTRQKTEPRKTSQQSSGTSREVREHVDAPPKLIEVSLDENGVATVSRYAGLFFVFVGVCFAARALTFLHVETEILSLHTVPFSKQVSQKAEIISAATLILNETETTISPPPPPPPEEPDDEPDTTSGGSSSSGSTSTSSGTSGSGSSDTSEATTQSGSTNTTTSGSTQTTSTVTETTAPEPPPETALMKPPVQIEIKESLPVEGGVELRIEVMHADRVELFVIPRASMTERYLGKATRLSADRWQLFFDSRSLPNGEYQLFARIFNPYGQYGSPQKYLWVKNPLLTTQTTNTTVTNTTAVPQATEEPDEVDTTVDEFDATEPGESLTEEIIAIVAPQTTVTPLAQPVNVTPVVKETTLADDVVEEAEEGEEELVETEEVPVDPLVDTKAMGFMLEMEQEFEEMLRVLAVAIRSNDTAGIARIRERIAEFERQRVERVATDLLAPEEADRIAEIRDRMKVLIRDEIERTERRERIVLDRFGDKVTRDSDRDGISDYDEQRIYQTDPFVADTDSDGFTDGAEVIAGYDPKDEKGEVAITYESPKETGIVRDDILAVHDLRVVAPAGATETATTSLPEEQKIIFTGKALPSSFVTLYIFSTPIVVTVKADQNGGWTYVFDKELEDGEHELYVGMTDNAGKIIAKSEPFRFVKEAEAYSIGSLGEAPAPEVPQEQVLLSDTVFMLGASLGTILIGLVLLLLGLHFARSQKAVPVAALEVPAPV